MRAHVFNMGFRAGLAVSAVILMLAYVNLVGATATFVAHAATDPAASSLRLPSVLPTIPSPQWPMCVITTLAGMAVETSPPLDLPACAHTLASGHRASLARAVARVSSLASCERPPESSWGTIACLCLCVWRWRWWWLSRTQTVAWPPHAWLRSRLRSPWSSSRGCRGGSAADTAECRALHSQLRVSALKRRLARGGSLLRAGNARNEHGRRRSG